MHTGITPGRRKKAATLRGRAWILAAALGTIAAVTHAEGPVWRYRLLLPSRFTDECLVCGRPSIPRPATGTFDLALEQATPETRSYQVRNFALESTLYNSEPIAFSGTGQLVTSATGVPQSMRLTLQSIPGQVEYVFEWRKSEEPLWTTAWPLFQARLVETLAATDIQTFFLDLLAAPVREFWFSTAHGLTPANTNLGRVWGSDFLSETGQVLRRGSNMLAGAGFKWDPNGLGPETDAIHPGPGGVLSFSLRDDAESSVLGTVAHGDLVDERGTQVATHEALAGPLGVMPPAPDLGLDAVQALPDGGLHFSITSTAFSENLGVLLGPGDLLSSQGRVIRSAQELTAAFKPAVPEDYGLDAFFEWPSGEVWFSTEKGLSSPLVGQIGPGDVVSSQGYVVARNLELLRSFQPLEDLADFGLDALWVVSDALAIAEPPRLEAIEWLPDPPRVRLRWTGKGSAFQLERAERVDGPYAPLGGTMPAAEEMDAAVSPTEAAFFYRIRQW